MSKNHEVYKDALPISLAYPLPPIILTNPLTWIPYIYRYLFRKTPRQVQWQCQLHESDLSCVVTDSEAIKKFWTSGFFGKGNLSRSEPTWHTRTKRSLGLLGFDEDLVAEEVTARRRFQRKQFKAQRAYRENRARERQLLLENGKPIPASLEEDAELPEYLTKSLKDFSRVSENPYHITSVPNVEHLQLTFPEAFFLASLGVLRINYENPNFELLPILKLFANIVANSVALTHDYSLQQSHEDPIIEPDNKFLTELAAYFYFRQQGWVVKNGTKFSVDFLLYKKGPVFSHAEFAILLIPCVGNKQKYNMQWHEVHCLNRVIAQVKKSLILCYVQCPSIEDFNKIWKNQASMNEWDWAESVLRQYLIRCVTLRRWVPSRNRD
ncbi:putative tRNA-splicing endonuclease subunit sen2 [Schizosaccharomyces pombe]|uniref:Probable tRNA-splicing endonuclease subunit sen2 n=1 Tax=Schizosaccharomyces pombe (strain 972 / ATCC 24843) TaxID=284812 RepID=SEN2_SCHPO|nr:putative tRNA-splicing endonuclease catalytic subunit Sen2 [Schizosaccharomyces pombe]Q8TFH7.1 RecName: Full=Probable tRNA-splicing endonuclease subunit sen2; AltName: Full=tRNA-intron endonuclease sen2 [Schizosaccharomyces pombe 972h-]CAD27500.1 tRNA-splicing endonuclease subunit catalytic subunit Sen2 (predicted) [Schizosaccharomyces pombe]|eukprot:NP_001018222.1 putative tRNA-splicing endonuclease catalytic subunit Sen2 [Schizosaccharomyces pombe]